MEDKKKILIIDGNGLAFAGYMAMAGAKGGGLKNSFGVCTTTVFKMMQYINEYVNIHGRIDRVVICWDLGGGSKYRKSIFPHYKGNREYKDMDDLFEDLNDGREYLGRLGINQAPCKGIEADDVIGWFSEKYRKMGWHSIIC